MIKPYYETELGKLYHGDCLKILKKMDYDDIKLVLTDPPYPGLFYGWGINIEDIKWPPCEQYFFWMNTIDFPYKVTAIHMWLKDNVFLGSYPAYERIMVVDGKKISSWIKASAINSKVAAQMSRDVYCNHPTQKPIKVINWLLEFTDNIGIVLDPFMGSGTTAVACERLNRRWIGIEISKEYCDIAVDRIKKETAQYKLDLA